MPTAKKQVLDMVKKLPDKATWDDIMYEISSARRSMPVSLLLTKGGSFRTKRSRSVSSRNDPP
jgi:hypothetical protein